MEAGAVNPAVDPFAALHAQDAVLRGISTLTANHRVVVILRYWADLPIAAIADRLGVPVGTVKSRLHYALEALSTVVDGR